MGDRCYMSVTCRRQDQSRFEALGFVLESEASPESPVIEMSDMEANYAHAEEMPTDIPYYGIYGAGSNYGPGNVACDCRNYVEVGTGQDSGFVVDWDYRKRKPTARSLKRIRAYLAVDKKARAIIKALQS